MKVKELRKLMDQADEVKHVDLFKLDRNGTLHARLVRHHLITEGAYTCTIGGKKVCYIAS